MVCTWGVDNMVGVSECFQQTLRLVLSILSVCLSVCIHIRLRVGIKNSGHEFSVWFNNSAGLAFTSCYG